MIRDFKLYYVVRSKNLEYDSGPHPSREDAQEELEYRHKWNRDKFTVVYTKQDVYTDPYE